MSINPDNKLNKQDSLEEFLSELNHEEEQKMEIIKNACIQTQGKRKNKEESKLMNKGHNKKSIKNTVFKDELGQRTNT